MRPPARSQSSFRVEQGRSDEYQRANDILNASRHPTFIGRQTYGSQARNGGISFFIVGDQDAAVSICNARTNCLLVLCVHPKFRRQGLGAAILAYLQVSFARVIESAVPYFERNGFVKIGEPKQGNKYKTQIMVVSELPKLCGRLKRILRYPAK